MRINSAILLAWVVVLAALATGCSNGNAKTNAGGDRHQAGQDRARLEVSGSPGTEFVGSCKIGDGKPTKIGGEVPRGFTYDLEGSSLDCEISSDDDLRVELTIGENAHSAQSISGGTLHLTYENGSISADTSSSGGGSSRTNEPVTKETRNVSGFDGVELRGVGNLSIEQTGRESLTVEADKAIIPELASRVVNGRLILGPEPGHSVHTTGPINYKLTVKDLRSLEVLGTANAEATGIETRSLAVTISGAGNVRMDGTSNVQDVDISGTGTYLAENLKSKKVTINVSGAGSAVVNAKEKLDAEIAGVGSVEYVGNPKVQKNVTGAGRISEH